MVTESQIPIAVLYNSTINKLKGNQALVKPNDMPIEIKINHYDPGNVSGKEKYYEATYNTKFYNTTHFHKVDTD
jgi:hypothetical protein